MSKDIEYAIQKEHEQSIDMILGIIIVAFSQTLLATYLIFMMQANNPAKYTSTIHFAIAILGFFVAFAGIFWGAGSIHAKKRLHGILSIVLAAIALATFVAIMVIEYILRLNIPLF